MSRPDYCPIGNQPCQSLCLDKCKTKQRLDDQLDEVLFEKMRELLTQTANILKGAPAPLMLHSWHDLPEVAASLTARVHELERVESAARIYATRYVQDEADDPEVCVCQGQHEHAKELIEALSAISPIRTVFHIDAAMEAANVPER